MSQGNTVTVDVSSGSKCHSGQNVGGRNVKAPSSFSQLITFFVIISDLIREMMTGGMSEGMITTIIPSSQNFAIIPNVIQSVNNTKRHVII